MTLLHLTILFALLTAGTGLMSIIRSIVIINHTLDLQKKREEINNG